MGRNTRTGSIQVCGSLKFSTVLIIKDLCFFYVYFNGSLSNVGVG
nr:MAG TPA: hypothetical protein [Caudoviricetes sp.]